MNKIRDQYNEQGYAIYRNLLTADELQALREATDQEIAHKVKPIVFDAASPEVCAAVPKAYQNDEGKVFRRLNRVIDRGGAFEQIVCTRLAQAVTQILDPPVFLCLNRHNMLMLKAPFNPTPVPWHQDAAIWNEGTYDHVSAILALDDFLPENGCLEVVPGSHRRGPIGLGGDENIACVRETCGHEVEDQAVKVDLKAGDAVFFHGLLLHGSPGNNTASSRRSLTVAFFPGDLRLISTQQVEQKPEVRRLY